MQGKTLFYLTLICLCTACGSKNPGMSKEEAAKCERKMDKRKYAEPSGREKCIG